MKWTRLVGVRIMRFYLGMILAILFLPSSGCVFPHFPPPVVLDVRTFPNGQDQMPFGFESMYWGIHNGQRIAIGRGTLSGEHQFHLVFWEEPYPVFSPGWILITTNGEDSDKWNVDAWLEMDYLDNERKIKGISRFIGSISIQQLPKTGSLKIPFKKVCLKSEDHDMMLELSGVLVAKPAPEGQLQDLFVLMNKDIATQPEKPR
jgi:hypothetical protein